METLSIVHNQGQTNDILGFSLEVENKAHEV